MIRTLLLPCAGLSARYPGLPPKWLLTTPDGRLAIQHAASSVDPALVGRRVIAIRAATEAQYGASAALRRALGEDSEVLVLERDTAGPAETVALMIRRAEVTGPVLIKDADSFFAPSPLPRESFVAVVDLRQALGLSRVGAKSFVTVDADGQVTGMIEKSVASNFASVGLYGFADAAAYQACYDRVARTHGAGEIFVSHVVAEALRQGATVLPHFVSALVDVGTLDDWHSQFRNRRTLVVELDGVVFEPRSAWLPPLWDAPAAAIADNLARLRELAEAGTQFVFLSTRPPAHRAAIEAALAEQGLAGHAVVMGCLHAPRVLVGAYGDSRPYPAASAVNLPSSSGALRALLP
jgi:hypothetical protein